MALGAGRFRLMRQMLTENLRLAIAGGALGFVAGKWSLQAIDALLPAAITRLKVPAFNGWVLGFTLLVSIVTGFLFGLAPSRYTLGQARLVGGGRRSHFNLLIAVEVALSLALLIGSGLMIRILLSLRGVDPGFHARNALHTQIVLPQPQSAAERQIEFFEQAIGRTRSLPGVNRVSAVMCLPLSGSCWSNPAEVEGRQAQSTQTPIRGEFQFCGARLFPRDGYPIPRRPRLRSPRSKRLGARGDRQSILRAPLSGWRRRPRQASSRALPSDRAPWATIVAVVGDVRRDSLDSPPDAEVYFPFTQRPINFMHLVVRPDANATSPATPIQRELQSLDRTLPLGAIGTMEELQGAALANRRLPAVLLGLFAAVALILAVVGIYGVTSYSVSQRTSAIGIRMALGASWRAVIGLTIGRAMIPVGAGLFAGLCIAGGLSRALSGVLYGVQPTDPLTYAAVSLILLITATAACAAPGSRAIRVDPLMTLRHD